jgi:hypothetical protein
LTRGNSAAYWKNGVLNTLSGSTPEFYMATAIAVNGSDIYVAGTGGYPSNNAVYWKNRTLVQLTNRSSITTGIVVVQH